jgi:hypothetical protein
LFTGSSQQAVPVAQNQDGKALLFRTAATATETEGWRRFKKFAGALSFHLETYGHGPHD